MQYRHQEGPTSDAKWRRSRPRQFSGARSRRAAANLNVSISTALTTRDADSSDRRTSWLGENVFAVHEQ